MRRYLKYFKKSASNLELKVVCFLNNFLYACIIKVKAYLNFLSTEWCLMLKYGNLFLYLVYSNLFLGVMQILISVSLDDESLQNSTLSSILCQQRNGTQYSKLKDLSTRAINTLLQEWPLTVRRSEITNCMDGRVILQIRAENTQVADRLLKDINSNYFDDIVFKGYVNESEGLGSELSVETFVNKDEFQAYRDAYITFQSKNINLIFDYLIY